MEIPFWAANLILGFLLYASHALFGRKFNRPNATGGEFMAISVLLYLVGFCTGIIKY